MKAIVIHAPKDLRIEEHDPGTPGPGEVSVKLAAGGVCGSDLHYYNHGGFGAVRIKEPMILGHEVAGHVEAIGTRRHRTSPRGTSSPSRPRAPAEPAATAARACRTTA